MEGNDSASCPAVVQTPREPPSCKDHEDDVLQALYSPSVTAKIWGVALRALDRAEPPTSIPEYTPPRESRYVESHVSFWTAGFFPGSLCILYERQRRWPHKCRTRWIDGLAMQPHPLRLRHACQWWSHNLHDQAPRTDTHDLGFMILPWARLRWQLDGDQQCRDSLVAAAYSLASRFDAKVGCIRSWDTCFTKRYEFGDPTKAFLVIIDNMMNLDLLYWVADLTQDQSLAEVATTHATTTLTTHVRSDHSTCHVVNFDQDTGAVLQRMTNQGYSDDSCWSRGQAWALVGYAQCYAWTKNEQFLDASRKLADYFIDHLLHDWTPPWDFDAPRPGPCDSSAAMIAAYGLLLLSEAVPGDGNYLASALHMTRAVIRTSLSPPASIVTTSSGAEDVDLGGSDTILLHATINNHDYAPKRWADHGLVYADYYFLLVGNKLLEMGIV